MSRPCGFKNEYGIECAGKLHHAGEHHGPRDAFPLKVGDQAYRVSTDDDIRANRDALQAECDRLTVIANDMARLLLKYQWAGKFQDDNCDPDECPWCEQTPVEPIRTSPGWREPGKGHRADCELAAVLREAGVMT